MEIPKEDEKGKVVDPELAKARASMGGRIDPDPTPEVKKEETPAPAPIPEVKKDVIPDENLGKEPENKELKTPRPEAFIPMPKYLDEKKDWKKTETALAEANAKIAELTKLSEQKDGLQKDEDIEAFMDKTGFGREVVDGLLALAEKRVLTPELKEALKKAEVITKEAELDTAFSSEFQKDGEPALKTYFPEVTEDQLAKAKTFLDQVSHTKEFSDKTLDYVIFKHKTEIAELFGEKADATPPITKKTIEGGRNGGGKPVGLTAKDFSGDSPDFTALNNMDPAERSQLIKSFDTKTYQRFVQYAGTQTGGLEVMRNGAKVILK